MPSSPAVFDGSASYAAPTPGPVVTIGNFDGVHLGHRSLLDATLAKAAELGTIGAVYTFHPAPRDVLRPDNPIDRIQTLADKTARLHEAGIAHVVVEPFSREFGAQSAEWFAREVLLGRLNASALVLGWDFRFGKGREGTVDKLREWLDIDVNQVPPFELDGQVVSSSRIRQSIRAGRLAEAEQLLGTPHELVGVVNHGDARGRQLGFPTANVRCETALLPPDGVYAVRVKVDERWVAGVANLGMRPTFDGSERRLEVHLLDFEGDLYDKRLTVRLIEFVRGERAFSGVEALVTQIRTDVARTREILG
ncbi:MAG: bifunctional riboflavin kinase/FAD synthetase [Deltaproteobacteria bacterium]|nr:MAG: bifunctional riboflavin kinase/FAD synthetase [Deltaproteobacteria bacterium]